MATVSEKRAALAAEMKARVALFRAVAKLNGYKVVPGEIPGFLRAEKCFGGTREDADVIISAILDTQAADPARPCRASLRIYTGHQKHAEMGPPNEGIDAVFFTAQRFEKSLRGKKAHR